MRVAGVDGCAGGWVVALCEGTPPRLVDIRVVGSAREIWELDVDRVAIDIPIGLPEGGPRACDRLARQALGPRRSSVFPAPCRAVLGATDYPEALARSRMASGIGLSRQTWHLVPRILEVDQLIEPTDQHRIRETHPELAFSRLAGGVPMRHPKRSPAGRAQRSRLLRDAGWSLPERARGARPDDVADAAALALSTTLDLLVPLGDGSTDRRGLRMEIWG